MSDEPNSREPCHTSAGWRLIEREARRARDEALRQGDLERARALERQRADAQLEARMLARQEAEELREHISAAAPAPQPWWKQLLARWVRSG